ncbi:SGNH/GDSL hydrolase family protein [Nocardia sp. NBC_01503]|uniref:SGNH/GDSL hydrolase family protein n=1 Tax=Nocardia sp. NBC_01503 TaxID=2975997 RepID=UPI002E7B3A25|nr:SGNH/GDSL hydrolase family protein [Nocardia sp. NBC_01503]WTL32013.1 SGNH/GDSL hydrolase family protein [Nocardia sp. NBC_01503]
MTALAQPIVEVTDPYCLSFTDAAALLFDAPWQRFASIGDSLSLGVGDATPGYLNLGWPERLRRILRAVHPDLAYRNTGRIGATTRQALEEQAPEILAFQPDLLIVPSGANDIVRREPDWDEIERTLRRMWEFAASTGAQLAAFALGRAYVVPVFPDFPDRVRKLNALTRELASEYGGVVADCEQHPFNDRSNLLSADGIHFSTAGQAVIASLLVRQLAFILGSA